jgi:hypothetical protein
MGLVLVFKRKLHEYLGTGWSVYFTGQCSKCRAKSLSLEHPEEAEPEVCDACGCKTHYPVIDYVCPNMVNIEGKDLPCSQFNGKFTWFGERPVGFGGVIPTPKCSCGKPIPYPMHIDAFRKHLTDSPKWGVGDGQPVQRHHDTWLEGSNGEYDYTKSDVGRF